MGLLTLALVAALVPQATATPADRPETVVIQSGSLTLRGMLWRPTGPGPFPAILFNHGTYTPDRPFTPEEPSTVGPVFARHGYVFLFLCRRGVGLSADQGSQENDRMASALDAEGQEGRNRVQLELLEHESLSAALAGLAFLRARPEVDPQRTAVAGHSFGGSLTLIVAARDRTLRAVVLFGAAAASWGRSSQLRARLLTAVGRASAPILFIHAENDYATRPGKALAAEMQRLKKPGALKIYPAFGPDSFAGHNLHYRNVAAWEGDVFGFLDPVLKR